MSNVTEEVSKKILLNLDTSKAAGTDQIAVTFLRNSAEILAHLLRNITNLSIKLSAFPEECKIAKLKTASTDPKNYQPISFLPVVSKVIHFTSIYFQIQDYLIKKKLIYI